MATLRSLVSALLVLAGLATAAFAAPATWAQRHLLDTDEWTDTVGPLIHEPEVQRQVSDSLVDAADQDRTWPSAVRDLVTRVTDEVVDTDAFAKVWERAVRLSHEQLVDAVRDEGKGIEVQDGVVTVEVEPLFRELLPRLERAGVPGATDLPVPDTKIVLEDSESAARALEAAGEVDAWARPSVAIAAALLLLGVLVSRRPALALMVSGGGLLLVAIVEWLVWVVSEDRWEDAGGDPTGHVLVQAFTGSVERWLAVLGAIGVCVLLLGVLWAVLDRRNGGRSLPGGRNRAPVRPARPGGAAG